MCIFEIVSNLLIRLIKQISKISKLHFPENSTGFWQNNIHGYLTSLCVQYLKYYIFPAHVQITS